MSLIIAKKSSRLQVISLPPPVASIVGTDVVLALTNSALSGNAVNMKVEITAFAA